MIKYMLTSKCNRNCEYCITKNIQKEECLDLVKIKKTLNQFKGQDIMLTGGEPTLAKQFLPRLELIKEIAGKVYITTQNKNMLRPEVNRRVKKYFDAITFSLHTEINQPPKVEVDVPVYASILAEQFYKRLPLKLKMLGYAGLTINEEQRTGTWFNEVIVEQFPKFSVKVNRKGHCMNEIIILPDLTIINDFTPYL